MSQPSPTPDMALQTTGPPEPGALQIGDLTPVQAMLLEVYRTHTKYGFPGSEPGAIAHNPAKCHKCALLLSDRPAFEDVLPWSSVRHLHQVGGRQRVQ